MKSSLRNRVRSCAPHLAWLPLLAVATPAFAQADQTDRNNQASPPTVAAPTTPTTAQPSAPPTPSDAAKAAQAEVAKFTAFDGLKPQGLTTDYSGLYDSILKDDGGFRSWLYDHDLFFRVTSSDFVAYDVNGGRRPLSPQLFEGQKATIDATQVAQLSWKIGGSGEDITQLNVSGILTNVNWDELGPSRARFSTLNLYSRFLNGAVEIKAGLNNNIADFVGIFAGGDPILANGLSGTIPVETGLGGGTATAATFNLTLNGKGGLYSKTGIQRSISPLGEEADALQTGSGLVLAHHGTRPLFLEEVGIRRAASADEHQLWLRVGGSYNLTEYTRLDGPGTDRNHSIYALVDYQLTQPDKQMAYRGIYIGASALFAPQNVNVYTQSYEGRVYALGMVPGRPTDQMTLTVDYNRFSRTGGEAIALTGVRTHRAQFSVGGLYALHVTRGLYFSPSVAYIRNPSFTGDFKPALTLNGGVTIIL